MVDVEVEVEVVVLADVAVDVEADGGGGGGGWRQVLGGKTKRMEVLANSISSFNARTEDMNETNRSGS